MAKQIPPGVGGVINAMRVIAGKYRSRHLRSLRGVALRPTSDRLRETLFNVLGASVEGSIFVDLFAGTGAIGIEALSRGAQRVFFVENHAAAVSLIRENLKSLGIGALVRESKNEPQRLKPDSVGVAYCTAALRSSGQEAVPLHNRVTFQYQASGEGEILAMDAIRGLKRLESQRERADFIFLDPPYARAEEYGRVLEFIAATNSLVPAGIVIAEHAKKIDLPEKIEGLVRTRLVRQGDSALSFYQRSAF